MSTEQAFRDHELAGPPNRDMPDEICDRCHQMLGNDFAMLVKLGGQYAGMWGLYCEDCAVRVERCDGCGFLRCICEES